MFIKFLEWIFSSWYKPNHQHQTSAAVHSSSKNRSIVVFPMPNYHATFKDA